MSAYYVLGSGDTKINSIGSLCSVVIEDVT